MITKFKIFEQNTENDDHNTGNNWYLNNDQHFGEEQAGELPLDYFIEPDEEGDVDDKDYYTTDAGKSGLYNGVEPGINKGLKKGSKAIYSMSAESVNVQDIMSFPTYITSNEDKLSLLEPFYYYIKNIPNIKNLSEILDVKLDKRVGFSFVIMSEKIYIVADENQAHMLINNQLIPLNEEDNLMDIIQQEIK